jgi:hypothetical protein
MFEGANVLLPKLFADRVKVQKHLELKSEILAGAGAASVVCPVTYMTNTGAAAVTLANGTYKGQIKILILTSAIGISTVTPASSLHATIVFDAAKDGWIGIWDGTYWLTIAMNGVTFT